MKDEFDMRQSKRGNVDPFIVMDIMENARKAEEEGKDIIHMEVGQPSTPVPYYAQTKLCEEIRNSNLGYTVALGIPELRARISKLYGEWYNLDLNPERVIVTSGSSAGFILTLSQMDISKEYVPLESDLEINLCLLRAILPKDEIIDEESLISAGSVLGPIKT